MYALKEPTEPTIQRSPNLASVGRSKIESFLPLKWTAVGSSCDCEIASWTNAVVAICCVFVPVGAVGAVGTPVNSGLSRSAFFFNASKTAPELIGLPLPSLGAMSTLATANLFQDSPFHQ